MHDFGQWGNEFTGEIKGFTESEARRILDGVNMSVIVRPLYLASRVDRDRHERPEHISPASRVGWIAFMPGSTYTKNNEERGMDKVTDTTPRLRKNFDDFAQREYAEGFHCPYGECGEYFLGSTKRVITTVYPVQLIRLTQNEAYSCGLSSREELIAELKRDFFPRFNAGHELDWAWVIKFSPAINGPTVEEMGVTS